MVVQLDFKLRECMKLSLIKPSVVVLHILDDSFADIFAVNNQDYLILPDINRPSAIGHAPFDLPQTKTEISSLQFLIEESKSLY